MQASEHIRPRQTREMLRAGRHAYYLGRPLNHQATIDFGWLDAGDELLPYRQMQDIRRRVWSWWAYKRRKGMVVGALVDWLTWEAPNGKHHANWFINVPDELRSELALVIESRCRKVLGNLARDTVHQQAIWNTNFAMFYTLKGTEEAYARQIGINPTPQGVIWFRRAYASRALGRAAREHDWNGGQVAERPKANLRPPREVREILRKGGTIPGSG